MNISRQWSQRAPRQKCREVGGPSSAGPHAMAQLAQWLIRHCRLTYAKISLLLSTTCE